MDVTELDQTAGLTRSELDAYWMPFTGNRDFKKNEGAMGFGVPESVFRFCFLSVFS